MGLEEKTMGFTEAAITIWKDLKIDRLEIEFDCGGDSMGEVNPHFYSGEKELGGPEIDSLWYNYFEDDMYRNVNFYEVSDGHYEGEYGTVKVELNEEERDFTYVKNATAVYDEQQMVIFPIELPEKFVSMYEEYIERLSFVFYYYQKTEVEDSFVKYKKDFIKKPEFAKLERELFIYLSIQIEEKEDTIIESARESFPENVDIREGLDGCAVEAASLEEGILFLNVIVRCTNEIPSMP